MPSNGDRLISLMMLLVPVMPETDGKQVLVPWFYDHCRPGEPKVEYTVEEGLALAVEQTIHSLPAPGVEVVELTNDGERCLIARPSVE